MRPRTCLAALLLPLALTSCSDTEPDQPTYEIEIETDEPPAHTTPTAQLIPHPDTGTLDPTNIENAVRNQAATDLTTNGNPTPIDNNLNITLTYAIAITNNQGHINITRQQPQHTNRNGPHAREGVRAEQCPADTTDDGAAVRSRR